MKIDSKVHLAAFNLIKKQAFCKIDSSDHNDTSRINITGLKESIFTKGFDDLVSISSKLKQNRV